MRGDVIERNPDGSLFLLWPSLPEHYVGGRVPMPASPPAAVVARRESVASDLPVSERHRRNMGGASHVRGGS